MIQITNITDKINKIIVNEPPKKSQLSGQTQKEKVKMETEAVYKQSNQN